MKKPTPKKEIVANILAGQIVRISVVTDDNYKWIVDNASEYGRLYPDDNGRTFDLAVNLNWDSAEVAAYLESGREE